MRNPRIIILVLTIIIFAAPIDAAPKNASAVDKSAQITSPAATATVVTPMKLDSCIGELAEIERAGETQYQATVAMVTGALDTWTLTRDQIEAETKYGKPNLTSKQAYWAATAKLKAALMLVDENPSWRDRFVGSHEFKEIVGAIEASRGIAQHVGIKHAPMTADAKR